MPYHKRQYSSGQLQFITSSTYRRIPLFHSDRFRRCFVETISRLRAKHGSRLIGWVLMPEHFHLLLKPEPAEATSLIIKRLKEQTAAQILKSLKGNEPNPWCKKMLQRLRLPPTVHDESQYRVWQRRFYPFNVYSEKKRLEKLTYMHNNPVKRGLVNEPGDWPWSSWRFYYRQDASVLAMDRLG